MKNEAIYSLINTLKSATRILFNILCAIYLFQFILIYAAVTAADKSMMELVTPGLRVIMTFLVLLFSPRIFDWIARFIVQSKVV